MVSKIGPVLLGLSLGRSQTLKILHITKWDSVVLGVVQRLQEQLTEVRAQSGEIREGFPEAVTLG